MRNDALGAVSELAAAQHGVFSRRQAASTGATKKQVRRLLDLGLLREPRPGILVVVGAPSSWEQRLSILTVIDGIVASHRSAARLHRLDGFASWDHIEVSARRSLHAAEAIGHRRDLPPSDVVVLNGVPTTNLARTLVDLGDVVDLEAVERALDDARRRGTSLRWIGETTDRLLRPGVSGPTRLRSLLDSIDPNTVVRDSWFEKLVESVLDDPSLPPVVRQYELRGEGGVFVARFDLAMPTLRLGLEAHSREFHFGRRAEGRDEDRDHRIAACGWDTVYLGWSTTKRPEQALQIVRRIVAARSRSLGGPFGPEVSDIGR